MPIEEKTKPTLTSLSTSSGCGCKIAPALLDEIIADIPQNIYQDLLIGPEKKDDAAVYKIHDELLGIYTVDFFTPIVNDPFLFGKIAAANAISDVYAMGGKPLMALSVLGWPVDLLGTDSAKQVMSGALSQCSLAGIPLSGGHSIQVKEPFFGLTVYGQVHPNQLKTNAGAKPGDKLYITKPLGTGVAGAAIRKFNADLEQYPDIIQSMVQLNEVGMHASQLNGVHAMTDITGFGLLGHLMELTKASGVTARIYEGAIPVFSTLTSWMDKGCIPDNTYRNWNAVESETSGLTDMKMFQWLNDPQTNGGLLIAVSPEAEGDLLSILKQNKISESCFHPIGECIDKLERFIYIS